MIVRLTGKCIQQKDNALVMDVAGVGYEVLVPASVISRLSENLDEQRNVSLMIYEYLQMTPSKGVPCRIGFFNAVEKDFFLDFIQVSGIGPRAAVKALNKPISQIAGAIAGGDAAFLKTLPGIGLQKAKEIIAKLQNKVGKYGLIQDGGAQAAEASPSDDVETEVWQQEALDVLTQLQYKRVEAKDMVHKALEKQPGISSTEELLNEIYKQKRMVV